MVPGRKSDGILRRTERSTVRPNVWSRARGLKKICRFDVDVGFE